MCLKKKKGPNHTTAEKLVKLVLTCINNSLLRRKAAQAKILIKQLYDVINYQWHSWWEQLSHTVAEIYNWKNYTIWTSLQLRKHLTTRYESTLGKYLSYWIQWLFDAFNLQNHAKLGTFFFFKFSQWWFLSNDIAWKGHPGFTQGCSSYKHYLNERLLCISILSTVAALTLWSQREINPNYSHWTFLFYHIKKWFHKYKNLFHTYESWLLSKR